MFIIIVFHWTRIWIKNAREQGFLFRRCVLTALIVSNISYISLSRVTFRIFQCVDVYDGTDINDDHTAKYWETDTSIFCRKNGHLLLTIFVGIPLLLFSFFFPISLGLYLRRIRRRRQLDDPRVRETVGLFYRGYEEKYVFWEVIILLRKVILSLIVVYAFPLGGNLQGLFAACILILSLFFQTRLNPFKRSLGHLNELECSSLLVGTFMFLSGIILHDPKMDSDVVAALHVVCIFVANIGWLVAIVCIIILVFIEQLRYLMLIAGIQCETMDRIEILKIFIRFHSEKAMELAKRISGAPNDPTEASENETSSI